MLIRPALSSDEDAIWEIFQQVVAGRDTYAFAPNTGRSAGVGYWFGPNVTSFVAERDSRVVGMYKLIAIGDGLRSHVSNASFMVAPQAAGKGVGRAMGFHALHEARTQGYDAMQFNFVVSTNARAVALWQQLGFQIVGTLPRAFRHGRLGLVDAYVMHRFLDDIVLTFGAAPEGQRATIRPSAYAVVGSGGRIALIRAREDVMLPGGALDGRERAVDAASREVAEECALRVRIVQPLGSANQFVGGRDARPLVEKQSSFFSATVEAVIDGQPPEHEVLWVTLEDALQMTTSESHRWALRRWARLNT